MSMNFSALLEAVDGSRGYYGGAIHDEMPAMSLDECFAAASLGIMNSHLDIISNTAETNGALIEATINSIGTGNTYELQSIIEGAIDTLKEKVKAIFAKIKKFLESIISKLALTINKIRMTGHQLYTKYKDSKMIIGKNFKDMEVEGYEFTGKDLFTPGSKYDSGVEPLIEALIGAEKKKAEDLYNKAVENYSDSAYDAAKDAIDEIKDLSPAEVQFRMVNQLVTCGSSLSESNWQSDLKKELGMHEKKTLKYAKDFTLDTVAMLLKEPAELEKIKEEYETLARAVEKDRDAFTRRMEKDYATASKKIADNTPGKTEADRTNNANQSKVLGLLSSMKEELLKHYNAGYAVINQVKNIKYNFEKAKVDQAKVIFSKMLSYKEPKNDNNSAGDFENYVDIDVDL